MLAASWQVSKPGRGASDVAQLLAVHRNEGPAVTALPDDDRALHISHRRDVDRLAERRELAQQVRQVAAGDPDFSPTARQASLSRPSAMAAGTGR
jgi:hypothetical protein